MEQEIAYSKNNRQPPQATKNSKKKDEKYQPRLALVLLDKNLRNEKWWRKMPLKTTHERTLAPTLPQAVENSIVATSRTLTHASICERINSKPRTFSAYSNFCSSYKLNCFCSFLNRLQLYVIYKKTQKIYLLKKKSDHAYILSKIY